MAPRTGRRAHGTARLAVIGAATLEGSRLREALATLGIPGARVDLYGTTGGEVVLSEYAGEARLIQEPEIHEILEHDVIFLCERGELSCRVARDVTPGGVAIDLVDALPRSSRPLLVHMDLNASAIRGHTGPLAVPHPLAIVLADLLAPLDRELGVERASAVVLRPAIDHGDEGVEELREQTVRLLNFGEVPTATFGRQLAFNVLPGGTPALGTGIAEDLASLLGWQEPRIAVTLLTAAVFHGHGLQLSLRLREGAGRNEILDVYRNATSIEIAEGGAGATPLEVCTECRIRVSEPVQDGLGGYWLWAVAGETGTLGTEHAVRLANSLSDL